MVCERCGKNRVSTVTTTLVEGRQVASYLCDPCRRAEAEGQSVRPSLERPCASCGVREGTVKLTRLSEGGRRVSYLCEACAQPRGRKG
jgi:protein-arginine kinase activator protein McsA